MAKARFNEQLINELKGLVAQHARWAELAPDERPMTKLQDLKTIYQQQFKGRSPHKRAMRKVAEYIDVLQKALPNEPFDESEHPRDEDGKFTEKGSAAPPPKAEAKPKQPKAPRPTLMPRTKTLHREQQKQYEGYRALTSDALPTKFYETTGQWARAGIAAGLGIGTARSLVRGKEGIVQRGIGAVGEKVGQIAAGAVVSGPVTVGRVAAVKGRNVLNAVRKKPPLPADAFKDQAKAISAASMRVGGKVGRTLSQIPGALLGAGIRRAADAAESYGPSMRVPKIIGATRAGKIARAAVIGGAGVAFATKWDSILKDTVIDPQVWGRGIDPFSYRVVRKSADGHDALEEYRQAALAVLRKGQDPKDLTKAFVSPSRLIQAGMRSPIQQATMAARNSIFGAIGGAATAYGVGRATGNIGGGKKGNPYRDEHGRFTSKDRAAMVIGGGALAGAIVGGGMALMAARRGNRRALTQIVNQTLTSRFSNLRTKVSQGFGAAEAFKKNKGSFIDDVVSNANKRERTPPSVSKYLAAKAETQKYGVATPLHYQEAVRKEANDAIIDQLKSARDFVVDLKTGDTVGKLLDAQVSDHRKVANVLPTLRSVVEKYSPADFRRAMAKLPKTQQDEVNRIIAARNNLVNQVKPAVESHLSELEQSAAKLAAVKSNRAAALKAFDAAEERLNKIPEKSPLLAEARKTFKSAQNELNAADKSLQATTKAHQDLISRGPNIVSPKTGKPIPAPTQQDAQANLNALESKARADAEKIFNRSLENIKQRQLAEINIREARATAGAAIVGQRYSPPRKAWKAQGALLRAHEKVRSATARLNELNSAQKALADASKLRGKGAAAIKSEAQARYDAAILAIDGAKGKPFKDAVKIAQAELDVANNLRGAAARNYRQAFTVKERPPLRLLPEPVRRVLKEAQMEMDVWSGNVAKSVRAFLGKPTPAKYAAMAQRMKGQVKDEVKNTWRHTVMKNTPEGWVLDPVKLMRAIPMGRAMAVTAASAVPSYIAYTIDYANALGTDIPKPKKPKTDLRMERMQGPSGAGYIGWSIPDPANKNERIFVWGRRIQAETNIPREEILPGTRVNEFRNQNQQQQGGGRSTSGDAQGLPSDLVTAISKAAQNNRVQRETPDYEGAPEIAWRHGADSDPARQSVSRQLLSQIRKTAKTNDGRPSGGSFWRALGQVFSKQGEVLKQGQIVGLLTGVDAQGALGQGLFESSPRWKSANVQEVIDQLGDEVSRIMTSNPPRDDYQRDNLIRAVYTIGKFKQIPRDDMAVFFDTIRGPSAFEKSAFDLDRVTSASLPSGWEASDLENLTKGHARDVARAAGIQGRYNLDDTAVTLGKFAVQVHAVSGLDMQNSVRIVSRAAINSAEANRTDAKTALDTYNYDYFQNEVERLINSFKRNQMNRAYGLDGLLEKVNFGAMGNRFFNGDLHPRHPAGSARGGEFAPKGGGGVAPGGDVAPPATHPRLQQRGGQSKQAPSDPRLKGGPQTGERSVLDPHRIGAELGGAFGGQAAWQLAGKFLPSGEKAGERVAAKIAAKAGANPALGMKIAAKILPGAASALAGSVGTGVKLVAAIGSGMAASSAGQKIADAGYRAVGKKPPKHYEPPATTGFGEVAAEFVGSMAGMAGGAAIGAVGGPGGSFAGGVAGNYLGADAGRRIYRFMSGYDPKAIDRVGRYFKGLTS